MRGDGGGGGCGVSANVQQLYTAQINFGDLTLYLTYAQTPRTELNVGTIPLPSLLYPSPPVLFLG